MPVFGSQQEKTKINTVGDHESQSSYENVVIAATRRATMSDDTTSLGKQTGLILICH